MDKSETGLTNCCNSLLKLLLQAEKVKVLVKCLNLGYFQEVNGDVHERTFKEIAVMEEIIEDYSETLYKQLFDFLSELEAVAGAYDS